MWDFIKKVFRDICSAALDFFLFTTGFVLCIGFVGGLFAGKFLPAIIMGLIGLVLCLRHADYLIPFAGGYHAEILRFLVDASACVLHFEFGMAFGAGAAFKGVA